MGAHGKLSSSLLAASVVMGGGKPYWRNILRTGPIAYWPLWEPSGAVVNDVSGNGFNGSYTNVNLGNAGIGDGKTAPYFTGSGSVADVFSAGLAAAFPTAAGTLMTWSKVENIGVYTDGVNRYMFFANTDDNSSGLMQRRETTNNRLGHRYRSGGTNNLGLVDGVTDTDWVQWWLTWSKAANQVKIYKSNAQVGATLTGLGVWAGTLSVATIGAGNAGGSWSWRGWLAHVALWDRVLVP
jgi:hypothetical protein